MNNSSPSFGSLAATSNSIEDLLALEHAHGRAQTFQAVEGLVAHVLARLAGMEPAVELNREKSEVSLIGLSGSQRSFVDSTYAAIRQQERGAWFLPRSASVHAGVINLPALLRAYGRFGIGMAWDWIERRDVELSSSPDAVFAWSVLTPLADDLFLPFRLRGPLSGEKTREEQLALWDRVDQLLRALDLHLHDELEVMRYGGGWSLLRSAEQHTARLRVLEALAARLRPGMASKYRACRLLPLLDQYYTKANQQGQATRKQVVTSASLRAALSGFFGGDWPAFLSYLGEQPHPREQVVTALPAPRLHVGGTKRAEEIAAASGVPVDEVAKIAGVLFKRSGGLSPIEDRTAALHRFWQVFDELHSGQRPTMPSLWGLVEDYGHIEFGIGPEHYHPRLYYELLPPSLLSTIRRHWGTIMLPRWPERLVTEPFPHAQMAQTFGPALRFWHGVSLTAWFVCEGPYSRTDIPGMSRYYERDVTVLEQMRTPVDARLFSDLLEADHRLGEPQPIHDSSQTFGPTSGMSITLSTSVGARREGFEQLRNIITHHRREWTEHHLARYLEACWEAELKDAHGTFHRLLADHGKPPTAKRFGRGAEAATNHWFGGSISRLYEALGEKPPPDPEYHPIIPSVAADPDKFGASVFRALGGDPAYRGYVGNPSAEERRTHEQQNALRNLAGRSLWYLQLEEALGRRPTLREFGRGPFEWMTKLFDKEVDDLWAHFERAVQGARAERERVHIQNTGSVGSDSDCSQEIVGHPESADNGRSQSGQGSKRPWFRLVRNQRH